MKLHRNDAAEKLSKLSYTSYSTDRLQRPHVALKIAQGWLVGADRGEWGGELMLITDDRKPIIMAEENVANLHFLGKRIVVTTGLAHIFSNRGMLYEVRQNQYGNLHAVEWLRLPGEPQYSRVVETGELLIDAYGGGTILLAEDGTMGMAPCLDAD